MMFAGLGMYCIGGLVIGLILSIVIAVMIIRQRREQERLKKEARLRLLAWEQDEEQAMMESKQRLREMKAQQA